VEPKPTSKRKRGVWERKREVVKEKVGGEFFLHLME